MPPNQTRAGAVTAAALLLLLASGPATAHVETFPIPGDEITISVPPLPAIASFSFRATGNEVIPVDHDPRTDGAGVLVRGVIGGGDGGRTPLISLDRTLWAPISGGFQYTDDAGTRGGITSVTWRAGELVIEGAGPAWPWSPAGAQDSIWVHFQMGDTGYCARFDAAQASANGPALFEAADAPVPGLACPAQVCGDGIAQPGEACDDGNLDSGDGCEPTCQIGACNAQSYDSTFEAIQDVVFEGGYGCTIGACHDPVEPKNGLDLTTAAAWEDLMGPDDAGAPSQDYPELKLVEPGEPDLSYLYIKLAARTLPGQSFVVDPGVGMPSGGRTALTQEHLEAVRRWIRGGAPHEGVVEGTQALLGTCLPPPTPLKIPPPAAPPPGAGVQLRQTPWPLPPTNETEIGEDEICMATYYDLSTVVPAEAQVDCPPWFQPSATNNVNNPSGKCLRWSQQTLYQDPQSHHSIIHVYTGQYSTADPGWGQWTYKLEPTDPEYGSKNGQPCVPTDVDPATGQNRGCSGAVVPSVACVGYGPPDASQFGNIAGGGGGNLPTFSGSQEPFYAQQLATGVYDTLPIAGVVVWNSHAFNLTPTPSTMAQYLNLDLAPPDEQRYPLQGIFAARWIFAQDTLPFTTEEVCATYTIPQHARLFELSSHTHVRGTRWRTWAPPNTPCQPGCPAPYNVNPFFTPCSSDGDLPICAGPRPDPPIYTSTDYSDPLQLEFDPPKAYHSEAEEDRTFLFCSRYDNGSTPESPHVKRRSQTPMPPGLPGLPGIPFPISPDLLNLYGIGGPCPAEQTYCVDGPNRGAHCGGDHSLCGDPANEWCDACAARGGVTTEDEMFILLGSYYIPEPGTTALGVAAAGALAGLARRRRSRAAGSAPQAAPRASGP
jgi:cysteine-rich repeat protein